jgi:oligoendopeptidase F
VTAGEALADPQALAAEWQLADLVDGGGDAGVEPILDDAAARTDSFVGAYQHAVAELDAAGLIDAMRALGAIRELVLRASVYAELRFAADSADPACSALLDRVRRRTTELETKLIFFNLEWTALAPDRATSLLDAAGEELEFAAHHLRTQQLLRPYILSAAEERLMTEHRLAGELAWTRLYEELAGSLQVELDGGEVPYAVAYNQLSDGDGAKRRAAIEAMATGLASGLSTRTSVFNALLQDKATEDRLRGYPSWITRRNLDNQLDDRSVEALIEAVLGRYDIVARWCRVKAGLLGSARLAQSDLMAPVLADDRPFPYGEARELVLDVYRDFSPEIGAIATRFFDQNWIDAPVRPHKMSGAFCASGGPGLHPYLLLNYGGRRDDAFTMAHELGHGIHDVLAARNGIFHQLPPMTVAETASTFGELLLLERMLGRAGSDRERLGLLAAAIDQSTFTIFEQVAFNRFEDRVHTERRTEGELSAERLNQLYGEAWGQLYGAGVDLQPGMERRWSMKPHVFLFPGYVYAYAYGQLLSLSIFARYRELGAVFVPSLLEFLAAGGSRPPAELGRIVGVDLDDPGFWDSGLDLVEGQLRAVEELIAASSQ